MRALKVLFLALFTGTMALFASCPGERFDVMIKDPIALKDALISIVEECDVSLAIEGEGTQAKFDAAQIGYVNLKAVSAEEALDFFLQRANLHHALVNDVLTIRHLDTKMFRVDFVNSSRTGSGTADVKLGTAKGSTGGSSSSDSSSDSTTTIKTEEKFDLWAGLSKDLAAILNRPEDGAGGKDAAGSIMVNPQSGLVVVTGTRRQIDRVSEYLDKIMANIRKQVLIDVQIFAVELSDQHTSGVDWSALQLGFWAGAEPPVDGANNDYPWAYGNPASGTDGFYYDRNYVGANGRDPRWQTQNKTFSYKAGAGFSAAGLVKFLKTQGDTRALSSPKVLAMNNQPTLISVGRNLNYQTLTSTVLSGSSSGSASTSVTQDSLFVGVLLDITAQIDDDGYITMRLNPSVSDLLRESDAMPPSAVAAAGAAAGVRSIAPDTMSRRISSVVRVRDGDVIILGGMIQKSNSMIERKIPILGDIPFLGALFGSTTRDDRNNEIVFVLTPHILEEGNKEKLSLKNIGFGEVIESEVNAHNNIANEEKEEAPATQKESVIENN
ncbi:MAG: pilus (MSHA type) biogenesis protein MshL [Helicobacteraceae bacterium]|jgi:general secretion pathway protein D|nr:pilus (MSHA type) biogenesis protein MshL [Helicobacteraceae bacterium]